jgi:nucleotide-binding universal stress UspA family protein
MSEAPILICYDGSEGAKHAIDTAAALLGPRRAIVVDIGPVVTAEESLAVISPFSPAAIFEEQNAGDALRSAREGAERARSAGFEAEARADLAAPTWQGIVDAADETDAVLIVLGSRSLNGIRELVEGSISHEVTQHAARPVLIVPEASR